MHFKKPLIMTTTERIIYGLCKNYQHIKTEAMWLILEETISTGKGNFTNRIKKPVNLKYENELLIFEDESLGIYHIFHLPLEYSKITRLPTLTNYLNIDTSKYNTLDRPLSRHRSISPSTFNDFLLDIETYFEIGSIQIHDCLKELLIKNTSAVTSKIEKYGLMQIKNTVEFQVDDLSYPAITVTKAGVRPRRKFTRYNLNKYLIKSIVNM